jgi:hypothetical protein
MIFSIRKLHVVACLAAFAFLPVSAAEAQLTNGSVLGRVTDQQGGALPGVVVDAMHIESGIVRTDTTDGEGTYRLAGLPVGAYKVTTQLPGFKKVESDVTVNVATNTTLDLTMSVEDVKEVVVVEAPAPRASAREHVVDLPRVEGLPLNGRQLADVAATLPGVGLGFHSDISKSSQKTAQVNGGNGRAMNFIVDGGDNNDDTIGGLAQAFPLEAVEEFNLHSQRFDAEFGRGGSVMNIITRSGTNAVRGSWFTLFRDDALNAKTFTEQLGGVDKQGYRRYQYGGSVGGPIVRNKAHYFMAYEGTKQDTMQLVSTNGLFAGDGLYAMRVKQDLFSAKVTAAPTNTQYLAVRYARDHNVQPSGAGRTISYSAWATSTNDYDSLNVNHNWSATRKSLNEFVFQFSDYVNDTPATSDGPAIALADSNYKTGASQSSPQGAAQRRWQFRDDYSWTMGGVGLSHEFRVGANVQHTPRLYVDNAALTNGLYLLRGMSLDSGVGSLLVIGGTVNSNIPTDLYGFYLQDDWRVNDRLTLNVGLRYDYLSGIPIEQTSTNFAAMQLAGQNGLFAGTFLEDFGQPTSNDGDNWQPRIGAVYDLAGNGRNILRGGWGVYTDFAYTNSNVLTTSLEGGGIILSLACAPTSTPTSWCDPARGFTHPDGTLLTVQDPWTAIGVAAGTPTTGEVVSPRLQQPFSYQTNLGWSHELDRRTTLTVDYVRVDGRNLNMRIRPNVDVDPSAATLRYLNSLGVTGITPNSSSFRTVVSAGRSQYDALIFGGRRRWSNGFDLDASYTLSKATSDVGTAADELTQNLLQDVNNPFSEFQMGPSTRVDARHRVTASAIVQAPYGVKVASIFSFRSALAVTTIEGQDLNLDGTPTDHTQTAYRYTGMNENGVATYEDAGECRMVNCSRRAPFSQLNLRVSRSFTLIGSAKIEAIAEIFNVFNAKNPFIPLSTTRLSNAGAPLATFMQPTAYAGDLGQGEQRVGQVGFRLTF